MSVGGGGSRRCFVNEDQHFRGVCVCGGGGGGGGGRRCSVNKDQHFRGVCGGGGWGICSANTVQ